MKNHGKKRLFEMMGRLNPDFKRDNYHENDGTYFKPKLKDIIKMATEIDSMLKNSDDLDAWIQDKLSISYHNMDAVLGYFKRKMDNDFVKKTNLITGGRADKLTVDDIAKKHNVSVDLIKHQLEKGKRVEMEHTNNIEMAEEIAMDHLYEIPDYYERLAKIEKDTKK